MAPTKTVRNKNSVAKGGKGGQGGKVGKGGKGGKGGKSLKTSGSFGGDTKNKFSKKIKAPPPKQQKTKSGPGPVKKKRRVYTDEELGLPKLNMITPVGVELPKGKKKGKVFVDDHV